ncbi:hypothetical protein Hanom_Chr13g01209551 [Helianthus anomalus]
MILNGIYNSFLFYMWNLIYFQSLTYFLYFFSLCALFLKKKPKLFLRLAPRLRAKPMRLACALRL